MKKDLKEQFVEMVQAHQGVINSICRIYFVTSEDQKDARQEIILQLWKAYPSFRGEAKLSTWIYKVGLNTVLYQLRKTKGIPTKTAINTLVNSPAQTCVDDDFQQLQQLISLLKAEDKALVMLYLEGYSHKEIATTLATTPTNISTRLSRIKKRLQTLYKKYTHETK